MINRRSYTTIQFSQISSVLFILLHLLISLKQIETIVRTKSPFIPTRLCNNQNGLDETSKDEGQIDEDISDIEGSQVSLPRSYTLPREFKYHNKINDRRDVGPRFTGSRYYLPSTNSSDGEFFFVHLNLLTGLEV